MSLPAGQLILKPVQPLAGATTQIRLQPILLLSSDGISVPIPAEAKDLLATVRHALEETRPGAAIPAGTINGKTLELVAQYCRFHTEPLPHADAKYTADWDARFTNNLDQAQMLELLLAANYLDCAPLLDLCCRWTAGQMNGKTPAEIRQLLNIKNDFTPAEEETIAQENEWLDLSSAYALVNPPPK
jgi:S-phase kinase-associated protein 1